MPGFYSDFGRLGLGNESVVGKELVILGCNAQKNHITY